ncbi:hypothetical protein [Streptomyces flavalbus]|uniref:Uncharacterized protein n=1 Tax=Streptomyces flavalbus TaxID=2665155 RepID=A0ABW2W9J2_9ACTN
MKLGKALATGVAQERPGTHEEATPLPEETTGEVRAEAAPSVPEEVPVAR